MEKQGRRYDVDWLRVLAMLMIFFFHCARLFDNDGWQIKNNQLSFSMSVFVAVVAQWIMPLFFLLSAISSFYALSFRDSRQYIKERFNRLIIPLVFGIFIVIAPIQVWIERVSRGQFKGSFIEFYPHYFDGFYGFGGNFAWMGIHLWYLEMLFIFSLLTLPLFIFLKHKAENSRISGFASFFEKPGMIYLFSIPVFFIERIVNLQPEGIGKRDFGGWSLLTYLVFFIYGYVIALDDRFKQAIKKQRNLSFFLVIITTIIGFLLMNSGWHRSNVAFSLLRSFNSWFWLFAILGYGSKYLNFKNRILEYGNTAVLPFYILHQTVIVTIGFFIAGWNINIPLKYILLSTSSFIIIMAVYDFAVRRINVLRFLFGMKKI